MVTSLWLAGVNAVPVPRRAGWWGINVLKKRVTASHAGDEEFNNSTAFGRGAKKR